MNKKLISQVTASLFAIGTVSAWAGELDIPNTFSAGTKAVADEVNANFSAVETAVDDNAQKITDNTAAISGKLDSSALSSSLDATTTTAGNSIDGNKLLIDSLGTGVSVNSESISNLTTRVTTAEGTIDTLTNAQTTLEGDLSTLESDVADQESRINAVESGMSTCPTNAGEMVRVGPLCVDKYEASVWSLPDGASGGATQFGIDADDFPCSDNGNDCSMAGANPVYARSDAAVKPSSYITWFQAQQACANAGKRLLTNAEWQMAAAGTPDPGADGNDIANQCNTNTAGKVNTGESTGGTAQCVSNWGAFDMAGNLNEWIADWIPGDGASSGTTFLPDPFGGDIVVNVNTASLTTTGMPAGVYRGGGYGGEASAGIFAFFAARSPDFSNVVIGFRCGL